MSNNRTVACPLAYQSVSTRLPASPSIQPSRPETGQPSACGIAAGRPALSTADGWEYACWLGSLSCSRDWRCRHNPEDFWLYFVSINRLRSPIDIILRVQSSTATSATSGTRRRSPMASPTRYAQIVEHLLRVVQQAAYPLLVQSPACGLRTLAPDPTPSVWPATGCSPLILVLASRAVFEKSNTLSRRNPSHFLPSGIIHIRETALRAHGRFPTAVGPVSGPAGATLTPLPFCLDGCVALGTGARVLH